MLRARGAKPKQEDRDQLKINLCTQVQGEVWRLSNLLKTTITARDSDLDEAILQFLATEQTPTACFEVELLEIEGTEKASSHSEPKVRIY